MFGEADDVHTDDVHTNAMTGQSPCLFRRHSKARPFQNNKTKFQHFPTNISKRTNDATISHVMMHSENLSI